MSLFLFCFLDQNNVLKEIYCNSTYEEQELSAHLKNSAGTRIDSILEFPTNSHEGYLRFNQQLYWYYGLDESPHKNRMLFISDAPVELNYVSAALDQVTEGVQLFNERGELLYLNKTCEKMENLKLEAVKGKHILEIYDVNYQNSTILNTLRRREAVENTCAIFESRTGTKFYSVNTGIPVFIDNYFTGAIGLVYDASTFAQMDYKKESIQRYLKENPGVNKTNPSTASSYATFDDIIGDSEVLKKVTGLAKKVSAGDVPILLFGETGVGKDIFAQSIHSASSRRDKEFVAINCAALPATLIEGLLFGTVKGAFTGSLEQKGLFETADGGTIFLDELNSMDIHLQSKLLRVIQDKSFRKVGGTQLIHCDVRFISAINESPMQALANNRLREDLYYRLGVITIEIPPLHERKQDITLLMNRYLASLSKKYFRDFSNISDDVMTILLEYRWPGNVRELFQALEYACNLMEDNTMRPEHLPSWIFQQAPAEKKKEFIKPAQIEMEEKEDGLSLQERVEAYERQIIGHELLKNNCNITKSAERLGLTRQNLQYRMKKCGIKVFSNVGDII